MSSEGSGNGRTAERVDGFIEDMGERIGSVVAVAGRAVVRWGGWLVNGEKPPRERAETVVTGVEEQVGDYTAAVGYRIRRVAARAKEELDDIRAEAELKKGQWTAKGSERPSGEERSEQG
jgi:hypothetical protein